jgi:hypothetical protein
MIRVIVLTYNEAHCQLTNLSSKPFWLDFTSHLAARVWQSPLFPPVVSTHRVLREQIASLQSPTFAVGQDATGQSPASNRVHTGKGFRPCGEASANGLPYGPAATNGRVAMLWSGPQAPH